MSRILSQDATPRQTGAKPSRGARVIKGTGLFSKVVSGAKQVSGTAGRVLVKKGQAASFANLPFVDQYGNKVDPTDPSSFKVTAESRAGKRPAKLDPALTREIALTRNKGAAVILPEFKRRAAEHLDKTNDLRSGILSGSLETPGNKSDVLKKKLAETRRKEEPGPDAVWLQEVHSHLVRSRDGDGARLLAQARAMQGLSDADVPNAKAEPSIDLSGVKAFAPRKLTLEKGATHVVRGPSLPPVDDRSEPQPISFGKAGKNAKPSLSTGANHRSGREGKPQSLGTLPMDRPATIPFQREMSAPPAMDMPSEGRAAVSIESNDSARMPQQRAGGAETIPSRPSSLLSKLRSGLPGGEPQRSTSSRGNMTTLRADDAALRSDALSGQPRREATTRRRAGFNPGPSLVDGTDETMKMKRARGDAPAPVGTARQADAPMDSTSPSAKGREAGASRAEHGARPVSPQAMDGPVREEARSGEALSRPVATGNSGRMSDSPSRTGQDTTRKPATPSRRHDSSAAPMSPRYSSVSEALEKDAVIPAGQTMGPLKAKTPSSREPLPEYVPEPSTSSRRGRLANRPVDRLAGLRSALRQTSTPNAAPDSVSTPVNRVRVRDESTPAPRTSEPAESPRASKTGPDTPRSTQTPRAGQSPLQPSARGPQPPAPTSRALSNDRQPASPADRTDGPRSSTSTPAAQAANSTAQRPVSHATAANAPADAPRRSTGNSTVTHGERAAEPAMKRSANVVDEPARSSTPESGRSARTVVADAGPKPAAQATGERRGRAGVKAMTRSGWHVHTPSASPTARAARPIAQQPQDVRASLDTSPVNAAPERTSSTKDMGIDDAAARSQSRVSSNRPAPEMVDRSPAPQPSARPSVPTNESRAASQEQPTARTPQAPVADRPQKPAPSGVNSTSTTDAPKVGARHEAPVQPQPRRSMTTPVEAGPRTSQSPSVEAPRVQQPVNNESQRSATTQTEPSHSASAPRPDVPRPASRVQPPVSNNPQQSATTQTEPSHSAPAPRPDAPRPASRVQSPVSNNSQQSATSQAAPSRSAPATQPDAPRPASRVQPPVSNNAQQSATRQTEPSRSAPATQPDAPRPASRVQSPVSNNSQQSATTQGEPSRSAPATQPDAPRQASRVQSPLSDAPAVPVRPTSSRAEDTLAPKQTAPDNSRPASSARPEPATRADDNQPVRQDRKQVSSRTEPREPVNESDAKTEKAAKPGRAEAATPASHNTAPTISGQTSAQATSAASSSQASTAMAGAETASRSLENLHQVLEAVKSRAGIIKADGTIKAHIPLRPEGLGELQLEVVKKNGRYLLRMGTERADAARIIERALPQLKEALQAAGIVLDKADVEIGTLKDTNSNADDDSRGLRDRREGSANGADRDSRNNRSRNGGERRDSRRFGAEAGPEPRPSLGRRPLSTGTNTVDTVL